MKGEYGFYNIGMDTPEISVARLAEIYTEAGRRVCSYTGKVRYEKPEEKAYLEHNPNRRCPDIAKARRELGFAPTIDVADGVERYLRFLLEERGVE